MSATRLVLFNTLILMTYSKGLTASPLSSNALQLSTPDFCQALPEELRGMCDHLATPEHFCGHILSDTLKNLCGSKFLIPGYEDENSFVNSLAKSRAKRQVADECCRTPCSISHLIYYYCMEPQDVFTTHGKHISKDTRPSIPVASIPISSISSKGKKASKEHRKLSDENSFSGQVRKSSRRKHKARKRGRRKRKCRCRKRRVKKIQDYPPHRIGKVPPNSQPLLLAADERYVKLTPVASDNNIAKDSWSN